MSPCGKTSMWLSNSVVRDALGHRQPKCGCGKTPSWPEKLCLLPLRPPPPGFCLALHTPSCSLPLALFPSKAFSCHKKSAYPGKFHPLTLQMSTQVPLPSWFHTWPPGLRQIWENMFLQLLHLHTSGWQFYTGSYYDLSNIKVSLSGKQFKLMIRFPAHREQLLFLNRKENQTK